MASGMEFLIKSLGIDPEEVKASVKGVADLLVRFDKRQEELHAKIDAVAVQNANILEYLEHISSLYEPRDLSDCLPEPISHDDNSKAS